ncbi:hypothetical protein MTR_5g038765 [Medicago truncatula]|uniref:Uncharacterized protein n=1 Tax=Medicago truncatula TaxID=3880 RepID=A0A072UFB1_MEDTR|nr:hypothetical protein MTR_5g038765 [Medicago truncatula]
MKCLGELLGSTSTNTSLNTNKLQVQVIKVFRRIGWSITNMVCKIIVISLFIGNPRQKAVNYLKI